MSKKTDTDDGTPKKKKGKLTLILPVVLLAIGVFVGKTFLGGGGGEAATTGETTTTTEPTTAVNLKEQKLTLADGNAIVLGITLKMSKHFKVETPVKDDPTGGYPEVMSAAVTVFSAETREPLLTAVGKDAACLALFKELQTIYHDEIKEVVCWEFLVA